MSWLHNLLSSLIAFLMAIVLAHFGAHGDAPRTGKTPAAPQRDSALARDSGR